MTYRDWDLLLRKTTIVLNLYHTDLWGSEDIRGKELCSKVSNRAENSCERNERRGETCTKGVRGSKVYKDGGGTKRIIVSRPAVDTRDTCSGHKRYLQRTGEVALLCEVWGRDWTSRRCRNKGEQ